MGDVDLFNPHDGLTGRDGGPYLDEVERRNAETIRAAKEGREPDYDNMPATAGTPLVTGAQLASIANPASNPSRQAVDSAAEGVARLAKDEDHPLTVFSTRPETEDEEKAREIAESNEPVYNPASPTVTSTDSDKVDEQRNVQDTGDGEESEDVPDSLFDTDSEDRV